MRIYLTNLEKRANQDRRGEQHAWGEWLHHIIKEGLFITLALARSLVSEPPANPESYE